MNFNVPIPNIKPGEIVWVTVVVMNLHEKRTQEGRPYFDGVARNSSGSIPVRIGSDIFKKSIRIKEGLWSLVGRLDKFQNHPLFIVSDYQPISLEEYRQWEGNDPIFPRAYTIDIETVPLALYRNRVRQQLSKTFKRGKLKNEQPRFIESPEVEEEQMFRLGSLSATSGRIISMAIHIGPIPGLEFEAYAQPELEQVFGIDDYGKDTGELDILSSFADIISKFDPESDEFVGHNIIAFDIPFIYQRCLIHNIQVQPKFNFGEYNVRGIYDTMRGWWLGARRSTSLDDIAWALGIEPGKSGKAGDVYDLYISDDLLKIREYNLNDVRITRKLYERLIAFWGR